MVPLVDLRHSLVAEKDVEHAVDERRPQGDRVAAEGLADPEGSAAVAKLPALGDLADEIRRPIVNGRQDLREGPGTHPVPTGRDREPTRRMTVARQSLAQ